MTDPAIESLSDELDAVLLKAVQDMKAGTAEVNAALLRVAKDRLKDLGIGPARTGHTAFERLADELGLDDETLVIPFAPINTSEDDVATAQAHG